VRSDEGRGVVCALSAAFRARWSARIRAFVFGLATELAAPIGCAAFGAVPCDESYRPLAILDVSFF